MKAKKILKRSFLFDVKGYNKDNRAKKILNDYLKGFGFVKFNNAPAIKIAAWK